MKSTFALFVALAALAGCSSTTDSATGTGAPRGVAAKGAACKAATDCADPLATCRRGDVCTGPIDATAFTTECASGTAETCAGLSCVVLKPNKQNKSGICSMPCSADADCLSGNACVAFSTTQSVCLKTCSTAADCNGFACVTDPADPSRKACLAEPN
jgi:hypothetical protein